MDLRRISHHPELDDSFPLPLDEPFTATMARDAGLTSFELRWLVSNNYVRHPIHNVYVAARVPDSLDLRCRALRLVVPPDCVIVDRHAGWLLGAQMVLAPNEHLHLRPVSMFRPSGNGRLRNDWADSGERNLLPGDVTEVNGLLVTTPIRTAWDLGRVRWPDSSIAGLDAMLALGAFSHAELLAGVERFRGMRWITVLRVMAPLADERSQSPGESVLRLRWIQAGLMAPTPQFEVWRNGRLIAVLDLANETLRYAAEYDGVEWHSSDEQVGHDRLRRRDVSEEEWLIDVFTAVDLYGPAANAEARLRIGSIRARRRFGRSTG